MQHNNFDLVTSDKALAGDLKSRSDLMIMIRLSAQNNSWDDQQLADRLSISLSRVGELNGGKVTLFSVDELQRLLDRCAH